MSYFLGGVLERLLDGFWRPRPSKTELSIKRNAYFHKVTCFASGPFFNELLTQKGSQNDPKMAPKIDRKINVFFIAKSNELLGKMDPKWSPKWLQIQTKSSIFRGHLGLWRHLASKGAKWSQNGSKMHPPKGAKWS